MGITTPSCGLPPISMGVGMAKGNGHSYWVFLVESEWSMDETPENLGKYFGMGTGFNFREGVVPDPNGKAGEVFDWVESIADKNQERAVGVMGES